MSFQSPLIFLHVLGAIAMFAAWGIEAIGLGQLRLATTGEAMGSALALRRKSVPLGPVGMLTTVVTGIVMMASKWGAQPWILVAIAGLIVLIVLSVTVRRRVKPQLAAAIDSGSDLNPTEIQALATMLTASFRLRAAVGVGIVSLMTMKPGFPGSLLLMSAAILFGLTMSVFTARQFRALVPPPPSGT